jgi:hypothetical protein
VVFPELREPLAQQVLPELLVSELLVLPVPPELRELLV